MRGPWYPSNSATITMISTGRAIPPPMRRHWSGRTRLEVALETQEAGPRPIPIPHAWSSQEALLVGDHELQENTVVVGNFDVQHTGLASNNTVKPLNWHTVSLSDRRGLHADEFVMFHVGRMTEGTQHR